MEFSTEILAEGFVFIEGPRWRDDRLWISDMFQRQVFTLGEDGGIEKVIDVPGRPSGLGFLPDLTPLVVSMEDQKLFRIVGDRLEEHAVLAPHARGNSNDMVVDELGRAYVGSFGFDLFAGAEFRPSNVVVALPDGNVKVVAEDLAFPNGMVLLKAERQLVVAETWGCRLTVFDIASDGMLSSPKVLADLGERHPDGICLDQQDGVWVSLTNADMFIRVAPGGNITDRVPVPGRRAVACQLGGGDGRTLFCLTCECTWDEVFAGKGRSRVEVARVATPGAGSP